MEKDYKKLYEDAAEKVAIRFSSNVAQEIFSELYESEDEKIRKEIINYFKCQSKEEPSRKYIHNKWLSWLEKQGERKPTDSYCKEHCKGFQETGKCFADGECKAKKESEQNPAWSEEDEFILKDAITAIDMMLTSKFQESNPNLYKSFEVAKHWLKSFKNRVQPQPKQEWSEEDEKMMQYILKCVNASASNYAFENIQIWFRNIKNRVQPHWKPTVDQMQSLYFAVITYSKKDDFKPFDKVLVRAIFGWKIEFFAIYHKGWDTPYECLGGSYDKCVPYNEETKFLLSTFIEYNGKYKTW